MRWPDGRTVYYRNFRHGGFFGGLLGHRYGSSSRLRREIADSQTLTRAGIRVPRPVLGRCERGFLCYRLAIVTVGVDGKTLFESLVAGEVDIALLGRVGQALAALHETGFQHWDLHPANLIVDPAGEVHILDLEGGGWGGQKSDAQAVASLVRLARYWEKHGPEQALPRLAWILALLRGYEPDPRRRAQLFRRCQERYRSDPLASPLLVPPVLGLSLFPGRGASRLPGVG